MMPAVCSMCRNFQRLRMEFPCALSVTVWYPGRPSVLNARSTPSHKAADLWRLLPGICYDATCGLYAFEDEALFTPETDEED